MIVQNFDLNLIPGGVLPVLNVSQYDVQNGAFRATLYNGNTLFAIPANTSATIEGYKPDNTGFSFPVRSLSGSVVIFDLIQQMSAVAGDVLTELRLRKNGEIVGTCNFILRVERAPLQDDSVISESYIPLVQQALEISSQLAEYIQQTLDAASSASSAAQTAQISANTASQAALEASGYNANVLQIYNSLDAAKTAANQAAAAANQIASTLQTMLQQGELKGDKGEKGDKGDSGITAPVNGFYAMYVDSPGNLHIVSNGEITGNEWIYNETTGNLVYHIDEGVNNG